jgi:hypothetical protein
MNIYSLLDKYPNIKVPIELNNSYFFYISKDKQIIPWYNIFPYYFFIIDNKTYITPFSVKSGTPKKRNRTHKSVIILDPN